MNACSGQRRLDGTFVLRTRPLWDQHMKPISTLVTLSSSEDTPIVAPSSSPVPISRRTSPSTRIRFEPDQAPKSRSSGGGRAGRMGSATHSISRCSSRRRMLLSRKSTAMNRKRLPHSQARTSMPKLRRMSSAQVRLRRDGDGPCSFGSIVATMRDRILERAAKTP